MGARSRILAMVLLGCIGLPPGTSGPGHPADCGVRSIAFRVAGVEAPLLSAASGDEVTVAFDVPVGCEHRLTLASFVAPAPAFDGSRLDDQALVGRERGTFGPGRHTLTVHVFDFPPIAAQDCLAARAQAEAVRDALRQAPAAASSPRGRDGVAEPPNPAGPYVGSCGPDAGAGPAPAGKPCDGCVGNAGTRTPPGQDASGTDGNAGHRCDRNAGIGQGNPAHPGCPNFQLDFAYTAGEGAPDPRLIAGVFCVRTVAECYVTDRTGSDAVIGPYEPTSRHP